MENEELNNVTYPSRFYATQVEITDKFILAKHWDKLNVIGKDVLNFCLNQAAIIGFEPHSFYSNINYINIKPNRIAAIHKIIHYYCIEKKISYLKHSNPVKKQFPKGILFSADLVKFPYKKLRKGQLLVALSSRTINLLAYKWISKIIIKNNIEPDFIVPELKKKLSGVLLKEIENNYDILLLIKTLFNISGMISLLDEGLEQALINFLPKNYGVDLLKYSFPYPTIYHYLQEWGNISNQTINHNFNMGMGYIIIVEPKEVEQLMNFLVTENNQDAYIIGEISTKSGICWI